MKRDPKKLPALEQTPQIMSEMERAAKALSVIGPAASIFGSARLPADSSYCALAHEIGERLAKAGLAVIAGGGPSIMQAANRGAFEAGGTSVGLNIRLPSEVVNNPYQTIDLSFEYFYSRKATFFMHSMAYIALPGGFGTLDELFEALTLMQTGKIPSGPVILVGASFWQGLVEWIKSEVLSQGMVTAAHMQLFEVQDDPRLIVQKVLDYEYEHQREANRASSLPR